MNEAEHLNSPNAAQERAERMVADILSKNTIGEAWIDFTNGPIEGFIAPDQLTQAAMIESFDRQGYELGKPGTEGSVWKLRRKPTQA
jgi:hypothetical protein